MLTKFASAVVLDAEIAPTGSVLVKDAHRHSFVYEPRPGFLYVRSRAISSRCNDNFDEFPAEEIKRAYRTFIGKPVFVNHHNENHRRMRGVIVDAALHEDANPDGSPDTWVEVLMEVDAVRFPKLTEAILKKHIERTSMGTDVAYSLCSFCGNKATTPLEYCQHIPKLKGKRIRRTTASGSTEDVLVREICYGLGFFENSLLVEDPADPTAFFLGVDDRGLHMAAGKDPDSAVCAGSGLPIQEGRCPQCKLRMRDVDGLTVRHADPSPSGRPPQSKQWLRNMSGLVTTASKLGYGEIVAPADVDTLRDEMCPVCGEADSYDGDRCLVCGFTKPPDQFMDPDLEKAKETDLRQEQDDAVVDAGGEGNLECDTCGATFNDDSGDAPDGETPDFIPQGTTDEDKDEQREERTPPKDEKIPPEERKVDPDNAAKPDPDPRSDPAKLPNTLPKPKRDGEEDADPENAAKPDPAPQQEDAVPETAPKAGDACPTCGEGTLQPKSAPAKPKPDTEDGEKDEDEEGSDDQDGEKKPPPWMKEKKPKKSSALSTTGRDRPSSETAIEGVDVDMRPALAALAEQQKIINTQQQVISTLAEDMKYAEVAIGNIAHLAGLTDQPWFGRMLDRRKARLEMLAKVGMVVTADENNPAQPLPDPPAEAPAQTTDEALGELNEEDVTQVGATGTTDVSADATTSVESTEVVLDQPLDLNEQDPTRPVAGTEEVRPVDEVRTETEVRAGTPSNNGPAFPLQGPFAERATVGAKSEGRTIASLRLARLRIQAGIADGEDLALGSEIDGSDMSDEGIQAEIDTLSKVVTATAQQQQPQQRVARSLVPRAASAVERTVPSMQEAAPAAPVAPMQTVASAPDDAEFLFE